MGRPAPSPAPETAYERGVRQERARCAAALQAEWDRLQGRLLPEAKVASLDTVRDMVGRLAREIAAPSDKPQAGG